MSVSNMTKIHQKELKIQETESVKIILVTSQRVLTWMNDTHLNKNLSNLANIYLSKVNIRKGFFF